MKYLLQADGKLPNLALMQLGTYFRERGEEVRLVRPTERPGLFDPPGEVFGSSIFDFSGKARAVADRNWGPVRWGGTGVSLKSNLGEIDPSVTWDKLKPAYDLYPDFVDSIGFLFRGCRLNCRAFCVVPEKEGKPRLALTVGELYRGEPHPHHLHLLDNDFFGGPGWREAVAEIRAGRFKVAFSQGINIRMVDEESAAAIASIDYRDNSFGKKILYTAWDNLGEEATFKAGVATLARAGVPAYHLRVYMLVGCAARETFEQVKYRFDEMLALGCEPYPMVFRPDRTDDYGLRLRAFQRYVIRRVYRKTPWDSYSRHFKAERTAARRLALPMFDEKGTHE